MKCAKGFYCRAGAKSSKPKGAEGGACPPGYKCENGRRIPCEPGTFQNVPEQSTCKPCGPGTFCDRAAKKEVDCPKVGESNDRKETFKRKISEDFLLFRVGSVDQDPVARRRSLALCVLSEKLLEAKISMRVPIVQLVSIVASWGFLVLKEIVRTAMYAPRGPPARLGLDHVLAGATAKQVSRRAAMQAFSVQIVV